jgi:vacuolar-type H+-ATPase subunit I/STV1
MERLQKTEMRLPVPDPTLLTTAQILREVGAAREVLQSHIDAVREVVSRNINEIDKIPIEVDRRIAILTKLYDEKFAALATRFNDRDVRSDHARSSIDAAILSAKQSMEVSLGSIEKSFQGTLASGKEQTLEQNRANAIAVAKSEAATIKQIDQQGAIIATTTKALDDKISDVKDRLTLLEGTMNGVSTTKTSTTMSAGVLTAVIAACISAAGVAVLIVSTIINHSSLAQH